MKLSFFKIIEYRNFLFVFLFLASSTIAFTQEWKQVGSDLIGEGELGRFGESVSLSYDGKILAVGSGFDEPNGLVHAGSVTLFRFESNNWIQLGEPINGKDYGETVGSCVRLSDDGLTVAIGPHGGNSSIVRVYTYISGEWVQLGGDIDVVSESSWVRNNLSLSNDGLTVAIGFPSDTGFVRVYKYISDSWIQLGEDILGETFGAIGDKFGYAVSISDDGSILAVGAPENEENGVDAGQVSVFKFSSGEWIQLGLDILGDAAGDQSGGAVELSDDGSILAIGARYNDGNGVNAGQVRVFNYILGDWIQLGESIEGAAASDYSGHSVGLSNDGSRVVFGSENNDQNGTNAGLIQVYEFDTDDWIQVGTDIVGEPGEWLGGFVRISGDGSKVVSGTPFWINGPGKNGHVRVFELDTLSGIVETELGAFSVFPNPVSNMLNIEFNDESDFEVKIMTSDGNVQYVGKSIREKKKEIETKSWPQGIYFILIKSNNKMAVKTVNVVH